jgi:benzoate/toluate 1,2-dioxygenase alpha subunit/2,4,5-trichlorophenoxyacetic acid oxygenase 1
MTNPASIPFEVRQFVDDRPGDGVFRVRHDAFLNPQLFELEMARIFESTWVYVGLENEIAKPHDFVTTQIGRVPIMLTRDGDGTVRGFLNSCRHRGTLLCPFHQGHQRVHVCRYHGWTYDSGGRNLGITGQEDGQYPTAFLSDNHDLQALPKVQSYRGFIFASLSAAVPALETHLGEARMFLDLIADQGPRGLEYVPGTVTYTFDANWKYQFENGLDYYHFAPTHSSFVQILRQRPPTAVPPGMASDLNDPDPPAQGTYSFPYGHAVTWSVGVAGQGPERRPLPRDPALFAEIRAAQGATRTKWLLRQRNLTIFPNLQIVDIQSLQLRIWQPLAVAKTRMISNCLAPIGEHPDARRFRIRHYEEFFNPSGLATADDNVMYAFCQAGYAAAAARTDSQGYARGLGARPTDQHQYAAELGLQEPIWREGSRDFGDESCFHAGYREWLRLLAREDSVC